MCLESLIPIKIYLKILVWVALVRVDRMTWNKLLLESAIKKLYAAELFIKFVRSFIISPRTTQISMAGVVLPQLAVFLIMNIHIQAGISSF